MMNAAVIDAMEDNLQLDLAVARVVGKRVLVNSQDVVPPILSCTWQPSTKWDAAMEAAELFRLFLCVGQNDPRETWDSIPQCHLIQGAAGHWFVIRNKHPTSPYGSFTVSDLSGPRAISRAIVELAELLPKATAAKADDNDDNDGDDDGDEADSD